MALHFDEFALHVLLLRIELLYLVVFVVPVLIKSQRSGLVEAKREDRDLLLLLKSRAGKYCSFDLNRYDS